MTQEKLLADLVSEMGYGDQIEFIPWKMIFCKEKSNSLLGSQILIPYAAQLGILAKDWQILSK